MNTTTSVLLTGAIVVAGQYANDKTISVRIVVGLFFLAIILSLIAQWDDKVASGLGALILVGATFAYGPKVVTRLGLAR